LKSKDVAFELQSGFDDAASSFDLENVEKSHIQKVLRYTNGNKSKAAELLGIGVTTLYRKLEEYKITADS
jgi:two-component system NtrC family response regulator